MLMLSSPSLTQGTFPSEVEEEEDVIEVEEANLVEEEVHTRGQQPRKSKIPLWKSTGHALSV